MSLGGSGPVTEAVLATRHGKLELIAPALARVGYALRAVDVDTDALGTFSGEVPRPGPPRDVAVAKARLAMDASGVEVGVASEGTPGLIDELPGVRDPGLGEPCARFPAGRVRTAARRPAPRVATWRRASPVPRSASGRGPTSRRSTRRSATAVTHEPRDPSGVAALTSLPCRRVR